MNHKVNTESKVAVDQNYHWMPINSETPRGVKLQLLTVGGVAIHGIYDGKMAWVSHWTPLPKRPPHYDEPQ